MVTEKSLAGRVALITGGGRGVGRAIALSLAARGAAVAVSARSEDELARTVSSIESGGGRALAVRADVTQPADVKRMAEQAEQLGPVDVLVNNAGVMGVFGPTWEVDADAWWHTQEVNLRGVFLCSHAVLPGMVERGRGCIINVSSGLGAFSTPFASAYGASKAAVFHLTSSLAAETRQHGITVFAISPGMVQTQMTEEIEADAARRKWLPAQGAQQWLPPERAAELVVFLVEGRADRLSGRYIHASQDLESLLDRIDEIERGDLYALRMKTLQT